MAQRGRSSLSAEPWTGGETWERGKPHTVWRKEVHLQADMISETLEDGQGGFGGIGLLE